MGNNPDKPVPLCKICRVKKLRTLKIRARGICSPCMIQGAANWPRSSGERAYFLRNV